MNSSISEGPPPTNLFSTSAVAKDPNTFTDNGFFFNTYKIISVSYYYIIIDHYFFKTDPLANLMAPPNRNYQSLGAQNTTNANDPLAALMAPPQRSLSYHHYDNLQAPPSLPPSSVQMWNPSLKSEQL